VTEPTGRPKGRPRPPEAVLCPACAPGTRCPLHRSTPDQLATERKLKNGTHARAPWFADVPVPFVPIGMELEERPPTSSSEPPFQPSQPAAIPPPDTLEPVVITTTFQAPDSGRSFHDAGPMLARATLRKELEAVVMRWLELREHVRGAGRDAWEGRRSSPVEMARAEADIERVAKKLKDIR